MVHVFQFDQYTATNTNGNNRYTIGFTFLFCAYIRAFCSAIKTTVSFMIPSFVRRGRRQPRSVARFCTCYPQADCHSNNKYDISFEALHGETYLIIVDVYCVSGMTGFPSSSNGGKIVKADNTVATVIHMVLMANQRPGQILVGADNIFE